MTKPGRATSFYNPHLLDRDALIASFIARKPLLEKLVDDLRRGGGQHHLLIGPRGSGKTTLLLRLGHAIEDDPKLARRAIALRFPEEQYNVGRLSDFWLNCVDALVDALERRGDEREARRLDAELVALEGCPEDERARRGLALLTVWAGRAKKLLVLMVDNFDIVLDRLTESHWALRKTLSADNRIVLVGASSSFLEETFDYQSPFYDFFHIHELGPLDDAEARDLVLHLARATDTPNVVSVLDEDPGRFKALLLLSGGTPRTLALLHGILAQEVSATAEQDLESLLDQLTPYYKARFDDLPAQSQLIVDVVAIHWDPITASECAERVRLDVNHASAQLNRLVRMGVIAKVSAPRGKLAFQISERFFNIWYLMRAKRRLRRKLLWLTKFLQTFYGQVEIDRRATALLAEDAGGARRDPARLLAFASAPSDNVLRRRLEFLAIHQLIVHVHRAPFATLLDLEGEDRHLQPSIDRARKLRNVGLLLEKARRESTTSRATLEIAKAVFHSIFVSLSFKEQLARDAYAGRAIPEEAKAFLFMLGLAQHTAHAALEAAVSRGEVPSLPDVRTIDELEAILAIAPGDQHRGLASACLAAMAFSSSSETVDRVVELVPLAAGVLPLLAGIRLPSIGWEKARTLVERALSVQADGMEEALGDPQCWGLLVAQGHVHEIARLLVAHGWHERLRPLHEALSVLAAGDRAELDRLAPEIRVPALEILKQLDAIRAEISTTVEHFAVEPRVGRPGAAKKGRAPRHPRAGTGRRGAKH